MNTSLVSALAALGSLTALHGADIRGTVTVERKLTPRNVTPAAGLYQRGTPVNLRADSDQNPLDYERSHVVVYLEGLQRSAPVLPVVMEQQNRRFSPATMSCTPSVQPAITLSSGNVTGFPPLNELSKFFPSVVQPL